MKRILAIFMVSIYALTMIGCSTTVHFETDVPDAEVYVDGKYIGNTPTSTKMSNAIWEDPDILIKKEGYKNYNGGVKKEPKTGPIVIGALLFWPELLWCYGPKSHQYYNLMPDAK